MLAVSTLDSPMHSLSATILDFDGPLQSPKTYKHASISSSALSSSSTFNSSSNVSSSSSLRKTSTETIKRKQPSFGICFDVDGVLARGTRPIPAALKAFRRLVDDKGQFRCPVTFVTNSLSLRAEKAQKLSSMLKVDIRPEQVILAPSPLEVFTGLHDKFCLVVGQDKVLDIAAELGFKKMCTVEDIASAYPLLDVVDHFNRKRNETIEEFEEKVFPRVEAIILMGEPVRWESALQIIMDLLRTNGQPNQPISVNQFQQHIPVVACNMDLEFKDRAATPRFGHGAFLVCLESMFQKLFGHEMTYTALIGKPSEITFRFSEHAMTKEHQRLGFTESIKTMYLIGDTPEVDIVGSNLYQRYIDRLTTRRSGQSAISEGTLHPIEMLDPSLPDSRNIPQSCKFHPQTVQAVLPVLVCTGVYRPEDNQSENKSSEFIRGHRDFPKEAELKVPALTCDDVSTAVDFILEREGFKQ